MLKDSHSTTSTSHQELGQGVTTSEVAHIAEGGRGNWWSILEATDEASGSNHMLVETVIHTILLLLAVAKTQARFHVRNQSRINVVFKAAWISISSSYCRYFGSRGPNKKPLPTIQPGHTCWAILGAVATAPLTWWSCPKPPKPTCAVWSASWWASFWCVRQGLTIKKVNQLIFDLEGWRMKSWIYLTFSWRLQG